MREAMLHFRKYKAGILQAHEGLTVLMRRTKGGAVEYQQAKCGKQDVFCKTVGRKICEGRFASLRVRNKLVAPTDMLKRLNKWNEKYHERFSEEFFHKLLSRIEPVSVPKNFP